MRPVPSELLDKRRRICNAVDPMPLAERRELTDRLAVIAGRNEDRCDVVVTDVERIRPPQERIERLLVEEHSARPIGDGRVARQNGDPIAIRTPDAVSMVIHPCSDMRLDPPVVDDDTARRRSIASV